MNRAQYEFQPDPPFYIVIALRVHTKKVVCHLLEMFRLLPVFRLCVWTLCAQSLCLSQDVVLNLAILQQHLPVHFKIRIQHRKVDM